LPPVRVNTGNNTAIAMFTLVRQCERKQDSQFSKSWSECPKGNRVFSCNCGIMPGRRERKRPLHPASGGICRCSLVAPQGSAPRLEKRTRNLPYSFGSNHAENELGTRYPGACARNSGDGKNPRPVGWNFSKRLCLERYGSGHSRLSGSGLVPRCRRYGRRSILGNHTRRTWTNRLRIFHDSWPLPR
jgi:hypothetical protein